MTERGREHALHGFVGDGNADGFDSGHIVGHVQRRQQGGVDRWPSGGGRADDDRRAGLVMTAGAGLVMTAGRGR